MVCCNLCVSTDGFQSEIRAMSYLDLEDEMLQVIQGYNATCAFKLYEKTY
jgi:hypothetical protein